MKLPEYLAFYFRTRPDDGWGKRGGMPESAKSTIILNNNFRDDVRSVSQFLLALHLKNEFQFSFDSYTVRDRLCVLGCKR